MSMKDDVIRYLQDNPGQHSAAGVSKGTKHKLSSVSSVLVKMTNAGIVMRNAGFGPRGGYGYSLDVQPGMSASDQVDLDWDLIATHTPAHGWVWEESAVQEPAASSQPKHDSAAAAETHVSKVTNAVTCWLADGGAPVEDADYLARCKRDIARVLCSQKNAYEACKKLERDGWETDKELYELLDKLWKDVPKHKPGSLVTVKHPKTLQSATATVLHVKASQACYTVAFDEIVNGWYIGDVPFEDVL